jgi:hypothetical protein
MNDAPVSDACEYAALIADICKLTGGTSRDTRLLEQQVFNRLGYETTLNKRGYMMRLPGDSHWQSMPQILIDFGTAVRHTIGHRFGSLNHPLEANWYLREMSETTETVDGVRIAAWASSIAKHGKRSDGKFDNHRHDAVAINPAAALVAAWLRAHP